MKARFKSAALGLAALALLAGQVFASELIETVESHYNSIYVFKDRSYVTLAFGHQERRYTESRRNTEDLLELPVKYTQTMTASLAYPDTLESFLIIGMGGGSISWYLHKHVPEATVTAIELDAAMIELAEKYFQMVPEPGLEIVEADGRLALVRDERKHDIILIDAYRGPFVPFHLLTKEFYELVKSRLKPGGIIAQNIEPTTMLFDSTYATLLTVFDQVDFIPSSGNVVAIGYDGERRPELDLMRAARERQKKYDLRYPLTRMIGARRRHEVPGDDVEALTDDFAPVNQLKAIQVHNRKWEE